MAAEASSTAFAASRRALLKLALAAFAGKFAGLPGLVAAQDASTDVWNPRGNAGRTGELPGPGLDISGALSELWRISGADFGDADPSGSSWVSGYLNGLMYINNNKSLSARRLNDGALVWAQSAADLAGAPSAAASLHADAESIEFSDDIAIDGDIVLVALNNGHLWALDATTGALRWDFDSGSDSIRSPIVVDRVAYCALHGGVCAIELGEAPSRRWQTKVDGIVLGVEAGYVFVLDYQTHVALHALKSEDGSEFWRTLPPDLGDLHSSFGVSHDGVLLLSTDRELQRDYLVMVGADGQVAWSIRDDENNMNIRDWMMNETITRMFEILPGNTTYRLQALVAANRQPRWELELDSTRWSDVISDKPILCAGKAYALIRDAVQKKNLLVVVDPARGEVAGAWDSHAIPLFVADGVMLAQDDETNEFLAIGVGPAVARAGSQARVTKDATLRGAPGDAAIERARVTSGTLVDVTGDNETLNGTDWVPVTVHETGTNGWLPLDVLAGQGRPITFTAIDVSEFGQFTAYPKNA